MTDERRWTIWRCPHVLLDEAECGYTVSRDVYGELHQHGPYCPYAHPEPVELVPVEVVPVSSVVPITRLREWIGKHRALHPEPITDYGDEGFDYGVIHVLDALSSLLDEQQVVFAVPTCDDPNCNCGGPTKEGTA